MIEKSGKKFERIQRDAKKICARIVAGVPIASIKKEYGLAKMIEQIYRVGVSQSVREAARRRKIGAANRAGGRLFPTGFRGGCGARVVALGEIVVREWSDGKIRRWMKVDNRGDEKDRWMLFAQFAWMMKANAAHVPNGCRVIHVDGDSMNDDPGNVELMPAGDALKLSRRLKPDAEIRRRKSVAKVARHRGEIHRAKIETIPVALVECSACGFDLIGRRPDRCPKCGAISSWDMIRPPAIGELMR